MNMLKFDIVSKVTQLFSVDRVNRLKIGRNSSLTFVNKTGVQLHPRYNFFPLNNSNDGYFLYVGIKNLGHYQLTLQQ